ncbi:hypothetical protein NIES2119_30625 [[Phormidium ambiguum] IAM M-71]|uniref:Uncharacterized protein n=1 Tax=[Phormidium ambiguum] IAM M-71 TaxID=454136 RepID=A0A1U7I366_9CYAN|nr:hypothetical protein [Phormidium ambiguum]OKH30602.1 hypothetical protein NIES2119_30625 [Phormidium ambiguum IAM M-71]
MATKNIRIVGYLPPQYHEKLREYMKEQSITESTALVKIVKQFFDGTLSANVPEVTSLQDDVVASLEADMARIKHRLMVLEEEVTSIKQRRVGKSQTYPFPTSPVKLLPLLVEQLSTRLGVMPSEIQEAVEEGEDYFKDWSKRRDPALRAWQKRGNLFHPLSD